MEVLFVCTGNTCRSPMAAALLNDKIHRAAKEKYFSALSAGLAAAKGEAASEYAEQVMRKRDIDLSKHRAASVTKSILAKADIILTMTERHKLAIAYDFPTTQGKLYTLGEYTNGGQEIIDPFGRGYNAYDSCAAMLAEKIDLLWDKINLGREMNK